MKYIIIYFVITTISLFAQQNPPKTVGYVDLKKYVGLWYEIAKIPNSFQDQCVKGTTAKYVLNEDGEIDVINSCIDEDNEKDVANGLARIVDKKLMQNLKLVLSAFLAGVRSGEIIGLSVLMKIIIGQLLEHQTENMVGS